MALKTIIICDSCEKEVTGEVYKFVQPVALTKTPANTRRVDVRGTEFCCTDCMLNAFTQALTEVSPQ